MPHARHEMVGRPAKVSIMVLQAAEAAHEIVANGEEGKACFQEGHGSEPCPTIDYHPKAGEKWYAQSNCVTNILTFCFCAAM